MISQPVFLCVVRNGISMSVELTLGSFHRTTGLLASQCSFCNQIWIKIHILLYILYINYCCNVEYIWRAIITFFSIEISIHEMVQSTSTLNNSGNFFSLYQIKRRIHHHNHRNFSSVKNWLIERTLLIAVHHLCAISKWYPSSILYH